MPDISSLIDDIAPVAADALGGALLDRFLDHPGCDLLVVATPAGQPVGVVVRGAVRPQDAHRTAADLASPPVTVGVDMEIDEACALLLAQRDPPAGLVAIDGGVYRGVVSARGLLRSQCEDRQAAAAGRRFMEVISHEVRTPMNGVLAVAELLQRQPLSSDSQAYVRTIIESSHATLRALNDALELARANTASLALNTAPAVLRDVMDKVQAGWEARAAQNGVTLLVAYDGDPDLAAVIDAERVRQVFDGLIETALTLNRRGAIEASLQASRTDHSAVPRPLRGLRPAFPNLWAAACGGRMRFVVRKCGWAEMPEGQSTNSLAREGHRESRHESNFVAICGICSWGIESTDLVKKLTFKGIERCGCSCHQYQSSTWSGPWRRTAKGSRSEWARAAWRQQALHGEPSPHPQR